MLPAALAPFERGYLLPDCDEQIILVEPVEPVEPVEGASVLGLIGGSAITSGTWAVRGAAVGEIDAAGPGAWIAAIVVGIMPGRLNDGEQDLTV